LAPPVTELETREAPIGSEFDRAAAHVNRSIESYIERCRQKIPAFVESHFTLARSWRIQRRTLGLDFEGRTFQQDWLIVDALDVPAPIDHVEFSCDPRRPTPVPR